MQQCVFIEGVVLLFVIRLQAPLQTIVAHKTEKLDGNRQYFANIIQIARKIWNSSCSPYQLYYSIQHLSCQSSSWQTWKAHNVRKTLEPFILISTKTSCTTASNFYIRRWLSTRRSRIDWSVFTEWKAVSCVKCRLRSMFRSQTLPAELYALVWTLAKVIAKFEFLMLDEQAGPTKLHA